MTEYVVFCPGWDGGTDLAQRTFGDLLPQVEAAGYNCILLNLGGDNYSNAAIIKTAVDTLPIGDKVHLVCHSMGGLSARHYLKFLNGASRITTYIAIDTPQYGTWAAIWILNLQMLPSSKFIRDLNRNPITTPGPAYIQLLAHYHDLLPVALYWQAPDCIDHRHICHYQPAMDKCLQALQGLFV